MPKIKTWWKVHEGFEWPGVDFVDQHGLSRGDARAGTFTGYPQPIAFGVQFNAARLNATEFETDNEVARCSDEDVGVGNPKGSRLQEEVGDALAHWSGR